MSVYLILVVMSVRIHVLDFSCHVRQCIFILTVMSVSVLILTDMFVRKPEPSDPQPSDFALSATEVTAASVDVCTLARTIN